MKNLSYGMLWVIAAFFLAGYSSKAQNQSKTSAKYGVFPVKSNIDSRLAASNNLGVGYVRETQLLSHWNGTKSSDIDYWGTRKKQVVLNINNDSTPSYFPTNISDYKTRLQSFINVYADSIDIVAIENEELNRSSDAVGTLYHLGSMQDYINELSAAITVCKKKHIPVTNGGLTTPVVSSLKHYYEINNKQDSVSWLVQQMGGVASDSTLWLRTDSLLNAFKNMSLAYVNLHWYEPIKALNRMTGVLPVLCNYITQQTGKSVITNETGVKGDSSYVTMLMQQWDTIKPAYCIFWDGQGNNGGQPLTSISGSLLATGIAFRNFVAGSNSCAQSISVSPGGFVNSCIGDNVILTASTGFSNYQWNTGDTSQTITVKATGNYSVISRQKNCIAFSNTAAVFMNLLPAKPVVTTNPAPPLNVCPNKNIQLLSSTALSYLWSTGERTKNIFVGNTGNYFVTISDMNGCKNTSDSISVSFQNCNPPANLSVTNIGINKATLNWNVPSCAIGYQLQYRMTGISAWTTAQIVSGVTSSRTIYGLVPAVYEWRILTYCKYSPDTIKSVYADGSVFNITGVLNLNATAASLNDLEAKLFPVPAKNIAMVSVNRISNDLEIILTDMYGKQLWKSNKITDNNISLPVAGLASGVYLVIVRDKTYSKTLRLIKE